LTNKEKEDIIYSTIYNIFRVRVLWSEKTPRSFKFYPQLGK